MPIQRQPAGSRRPEKFELEDVDLRTSAIMASPPRR